MANDFDDVRLPEDIERGTIGGPRFKTTVISLASGKEQRNQNWALVRSKFNIGYGIQQRADLEAVYAFFHARRGMLRGFRFRNWLDYSVVESPVGTVPGEPLKRQLVRSYEDETTPYTRVITHPVASTLKVYVNFVLTNNYVLGEDGILTFVIDPGVNVLATFEYDIPVRFDTDDLDVKLNTYREGEIPVIQIIELV